MPQDSQPVVLPGPARKLLPGLAAGLVLGTSLGVLGGVFDLDQWSRLGALFLPGCALVGAILGLTHWRWILWPLNGLLMALLLIVGYTPLVPRLMGQLDRSDALRPAQAIVVLGDYLQGGGIMSSGAQDRVLHAYELLRRKAAPALVLTRARDREQDWIPAVRAQMRSLGLDYPVLDVGPVSNTHDEALCVADLVQRKSWHEVILITHAWHMRRAAAVFEKAGVRVICSPCPDSSYDAAGLASPDDRIRAFNHWVHEVVGYAVYRRRGWI